MPSFSSKLTIVILQVPRTILEFPGVLFTDGNASIQGLSQWVRQKVAIRPATSPHEICSRTYKPFDIPMGSNPDRTNVYGDTSFLSHLRWDIINGRNFITKEEKRIKHAEVLVPDSLPLSSIQSIAVSNLSMVQKVNDLIITHNLANQLPKATYMPSLFFS